MFHRILVAVDSSPARHSAVRTVGELAPITGATVSVLHVLATAAELAAVVPLESDAEAGDVLDEAIAALRDMGVSAGGTLANAPTTKVSAAISSAAAEFQADLLVLSPHQHGLFGALFNPPVSDAVVHGSRIPVLLTPRIGGNDRRREGPRG
ncbi:universal stress protein [Streptomyces atroolivaceus]|uniref:universal stress protein n=1 Tax=Streptomyces atroolivaceus TaxID=66869 RepID=UPI0034041C9A